MEELAVNELDPVTLHFLEYNGAIALIGLTALVITIIYSFKKGGIKEVIENTFLWFLLFFGLSQVSSYPVDSDDEMTAGVFFLAFGLCRMAKHMAKRSENS